MSLTLNDLLVECARCAGTGWEDGCIHGPHSVVAHVVACGSLKVWPCSTTQPATEADLVEILPTIGAERLRADGLEQHPGVGRLLVEPGIYLVLKVEDR